MQVATILKYIKILVAYTKQIVNYVAQNEDDGLPPEFAVCEHPLFRSALPVPD